MQPMDLSALEANYQSRVSSGAFQDPTAPKQKANKKKKSFMMDQISTAGGIIGGIAGMPLGVLGVGGGAAIGSGLGESLENILMGESVGKNVGKEALMGGLFGAGPIRAGKAVIGAAKGMKAGQGTLKAAKEASLSAMGSKVAGKVGQGITDRSTTAFLKLTPAQTQRLQEAGIDPTTLAKRAASLGKSPEEIIGSVGKGGPLQAAIKAAEAQITNTAKTTGNNIRIPGDELISALKAQRKQVGQELGGGARLGQLDQIIADAEKKYAKGVTVQQARNILRDSNQRFGASILDDNGDAIARAAQKMEGNLMRNALKARFPSVAKALDEQSELIQLREVLSRARAVDKTGKFNAGKFDLTRPGTALDPILNSNAISSGFLRAGEKLGNIPGKGMINTAARTGVGGTMSTIGNQAAQATPTLEDTLMQSDPMSDPSMIGGAGELEQETPQSANPYPRENLLADMQRDPANADKYFEYFQMMQEAYPEDTPEKPMSAEASKIVSNANIGLQALDDFESELNADPSIAAKRIIPGRGIAGGMLGGALGTRGADAAAGQIVDVIARLRTGAAITNDEAKRFETFIPEAGDSPAVRSQKLGYLRQQFQMVASRTGAAGNSLEDTLMQQQGAY